MPENTIAVLPKRWFIEKTGECFWPPCKFKREDLQKFIKHKYLSEDNWEPYKANRLVQYGDYEESMKKFKIAQETDKLSSTDQDEQHNNRSKKRNRVPNSKFIDSERDCTDKDEESEDDVLSYPECLTPNDEERHSLQCPSRNTVSSNTQPQNINKTFRAVHSETKRKGGVGFYRTYSRSLSPADLLSNDGSSQQLILENVKSRSFTLSQNSCQKHHLESHNRRTSETSQQSVISVLNTMISAEQKFREELFRKLNVINIKLLDIEKQISTMKKDTAEEVLPINEESLEFLNLFPMDNQNLDEMERSLSNKDLQTLLTKELSRVGGTDTPDMVKRLMYKMFTNEVGDQFSWDGAKGKKKFKKLKLANVIINAVRLNQSTKNATESDIIISIKKWLLRCKDRMKNAEKKRQRLINEEENE